MINRYPTFLLAFLLTLSVASGEDLVVVKEGMPVSTVVIGKQATPLEKHACEEFIKYVYRMSGAKLPVVTETEPLGKNLIVIGRADTNPIVSQLIAQGKINVDAETPGLDGFIIKTERIDNRNILILSGSMDRGTLYAVYHLLEHYIGVGFFENGDQIPEVSAIRLANINYVHRPRFSLRVGQQGCAWGYTYRYWDIERFKTLIDWMAKKKYNAMWWNDPGRIAILKRVFEKNKMEYDRVAGTPWDWMTPEWEQYEIEILRNVAQYATSRGIDIIGYCPITDLPESFLKQHPDAKILEVEWVGLSGKKRYYLHPEDPMFSVIMRDGAMEFEKIIGAPVHWWGPTPYGEMRFVNVAEEDVNDLFLDCVNGTHRALAALRPEFGWFMSGWGQYSDPYWTKDRSASFFRRTRELFGQARYCVSDPEAYCNPIFEKFNGFEGVGWCFGVIHSYGGTTQLFGNLVDTQKRLQKCLNSKWGNNLYAYWVQPEIIEHNYFFYEAVSELGWDPEGFSLETFTRRFVKNRYLGAETERLVQAWEKIIQAYYVETTFEDEPFYWRLPLVRDHAVFPKHFHKIILARDALDLFFLESKALRKNRFYQIDLINLLLQYNANLYNYRYYQMMEAFARKDRNAFEQEAKLMRQVIDSQIHILSTHPAKYVASEIEAANKVPQEKPDVSNAVAIRRRLTSLLPVDVVEKQKSGISDYARRDLYELVKDYYRPRVELYIAALSEALDRNTSVPTSEKLLPACYDLCRRFIHTPSDVQVPRQPSEQLVEIAAKVFETNRAETSQIMMPAK